MRSRTDGASLPAGAPASAAFAAWCLTRPVRIAEDDRRIGHGDAPVRAGRQVRRPRRRGTCRARFTMPGSFGARLRRLRGTAGTLPGEVAEVGLARREDVAEVASRAGRGRATRLLERVGVVADRRRRPREAVERVEQVGVGRVQGGGEVAQVDEVALEVGQRPFGLASAASGSGRRVAQTLLVAAERLGERVQRRRRTPPGRPPRGSGTPFSRICLDLDRRGRPALGDLVARLQSSSPTGDFGGIRSMNFSPNSVFARIAAPTLSGISWSGWTSSVTRALPVSATRRSS